MKLKFTPAWLAIGIIGIAVWLLSVASIGGNIQAQSGVTPTPTGYGGLLETEIRGLDPKTIEAYRTGAGLGLALPAELNGYPGPRHILELADRLKLTTEQRQKIQSLFDEMNPAAIDIGKQILDREAELEQAFRNRTIDEKALEAKLADIGKLQALLRFVHLRTHLTTVKILTQHQISLYNTLRGYSNQSENSHLHHATPQR